MKKIFTLISMALVAMNINAQDVYDAVVDGKLAPEFAAVAGEDGGVANNASNGRSVITITKGQATCTAVGGTTPAKDETIGGDALQIVPGAALEGMENTYEVAWIGAWNDINWGIKTQEDINFSYVTGTGIPYVQMLCVQNSKDGELIENSYSTDYFYYKPDGSWGIPMSGLYYTLKATATGAFKVKVALDKGVHDTYVVNTSTMKAERVLASGYIDGVNDGEGNKKLLAYDEVEAMNEAMGEDYQYVIGNGEAFWGWLFFDAQEGETYWLFQKDAQIGFGGFEFYEGMTADELNGVKPKPYIYTTRFSTYEDEETGIRTTWNGEKAVGNGKFCSTDEEGAPFNDFFQNDGSAVRTSYCLLPEDVLAHSDKTHELTIAFWVSAKGFTPDQYTYAPLFTAYAQKNNPNTYPMLALQSRGNVQVNCNGWCDFTGANNVEGKNNIYNSNAWEANDDNYNDAGNWLEDEKWHYYTAVFTDTNVKVYLDGEVKNEWEIDGVSDGQKVGGLFTNGSSFKYVCLGGNQAWDWNDIDSPFRYARLLIQNSSMTPDQIKTQMTTDFPDWEDYLNDEPDAVEDISVTPQNENDVLYNTAGQQVDDDYQGIVIKNGKKYFKRW
ncbi:MAG: hypothetical protein Q4D25_08250 [Bacteroidales bacterium]|nr:hypothetical protein [Bacteroidales bacterium]